MPRMEQRQAAEEILPAVKLAVTEQISEKGKMRGLLGRESLKLSSEVAVENDEEIGVADGEVQRGAFGVVAEEEREGLLV